MPGVDAGLRIPEAFVIVDRQRFGRQSSGGLYQ
jgi:hypothetical protein